MSCSLFGCLPSVSLPWQKKVKVHGLSSTDAATSSVGISAINETKSAQCSFKSIKDNFLSDWRVIPAMVVLSVCALGVILSIIWHSQFFAIPFGIGVASAAYLLYLAHQYRHLQSLEASSHKLEKENQTYHAENIRLNETTGKLSKEVENLTKEREAFEKSYNDAINRQEALVNSLKELEKDMQEDHQKFSNSAEKIHVEISSHTQTATANNETAKKLLDQLNATKTSLTTIFSEISKWKNASVSIQQQIDTLQRLNKQLEEKMKELGKIEGEIKALENIRRRLSESVTNLEKSTKDINDATEGFKAATGQSPRKKSPQDGTSPEGE